MGARQSLGAACCQTLMRCNCDDVEDNAITVFAPMVGMKVLDASPGSAPVGFVFDETMEQLDPLDRQLLLFAASANLVAIRWLHYLGASKDVCDANKSTALHVACRAGAVAVVSEIMQHTPLLEAADAAEWTPLHIAAHIGRREVTLRLLQAAADPMRANSCGHTPAQLCMDPMLKELLNRSPESLTQFKDFSSSKDDDNIGEPLQSEPEWFYVKPKPAMQDVGDYKESIMEVAVAVFNDFPSVGLALVVASGLADSYTDGMKMIIRENGVSLPKIGGFLGESISLANMMRFGIFDSMPFLHTGVVSALRLAFKTLCVPDDLQKIHRLVQSIALTWWRKHSSLAEKKPRPAHLCEVKRPQSLDDELVGMDLRQYLAGSGVLGQLMFSTLLLHRLVHGSGNGSDSVPMTAETWYELNSGIEQEEREVPEHVQHRIYQCILDRRFPELAFTPQLPRENGGISPLANLAVYEGRVKLSNGFNFGWNMGGMTRTFIGESSSSSELMVDNINFSQPLPLGYVRVRLCSVYLLFFSDQELGVPFSFTPARKLRVLHFEESRCLVSLGPQCTEDSKDDDKLISLVRLLTDGRWQTHGIAKLDLTFETVDSMSAFVKHISSYNL